MLRENNRQMNFYSVLYERIPEDHLLKQINRAVDFSFINEMVADSYCAHYGRPAKEPEMMAKLCILEKLYNLGQGDGSSVPLSRDQPKVSGDHSDLKVGQGNRPLVPLS